MGPVIRLDRGRLDQGRLRRTPVARAFEDEPVGRPDLAEVGIEAAGLPGMPLGQLPRVQVGLGRASRGFEAHHMRVGQSDMRQGAGAVAFHKTREDGDGGGEPCGFECLEDGAALEQREMRRHHLVQLIVGQASVAAFDRCDETVSATRHRLDVALGTIGVECCAQARDGLRQIVVGHGMVRPADFNQLVLGQQVAGPLDQCFEQIKEARLQRHDHVVVTETPGARVKPKSAEPDTVA